MITREQAYLAWTSLSGVFDAQGEEVTVLILSPCGEFAVVEYRSGCKRTRRLATLDPSRELLALEENQSKGL